MTRSRVRTASCLALLAAAAVLAWGVVHLIREVAFHGFAPACSDGNPEYDPRFCELPGGPPVLVVATALVVAGVASAALWATRRPRELSGSR